MGDLKLVTAIDRGNGFKLYIFVYGQREAVLEIPIIRDFHYSNNGRIIRELFEYSNRRIEEFSPYKNPKRSSSHPNQLLVRYTYIY